MESRVKKVEIGPHTLFNEDCRFILPTLGRVDCIVTDPPYGISHSSNYGASWERTTIANDHDTSARDWVAKWCGKRPSVFFGTWKTRPTESARACVVWDKGPAFGMGDLSIPWKPSFELAYICGEGWSGERGEGILRGSVVVSWESAGRVHPHQKPAWLAEHFIRRLPSAEVVLDPFMGSGSFGVGAIRLGRRFVGIEIDPAHFTTSCRRIEEATKQADLFIEQPKREKPEQWNLELK